MDLLLAGIGIIAIVTCLVCNIWMLGTAFRVGVGWGLACLFIPFAGLFFVISHWDEVSKPFLVSLCSAIIFGSVVVFLPATSSKTGAPSFLSFATQARAKADLSGVKSNMRTTQIAAESYAVDHGGSYPTSVDSNFKSYFPGGSNGGSSVREGDAPINPFTNEGEWPTTGFIGDVKAARESSDDGSLKPGQVEYSVVYDSSRNPFSYAIRGGDSEGHFILSNSDKPMVLSNQ